MATKLFLRTVTADLGIPYRDMETTAGSSLQQGTVNTAAAGTEIQWTQTAGGALLQWISGYTPSGGFTLTSVDISIWMRESNVAANCGGRVRLFKRSAAGVETEIGGGPFDDGVEFGTVATEMTWTANVTDTAFALNDRLLLKAYITNIGVMGGGHTCVLSLNAADGATGDSFINLAETVAFTATPGVAAVGNLAARRLSSFRHGPGISRNPAIRISKEKSVWQTMLRTLRSHTRSKMPAIPSACRISTTTAIRLTRRHLTLR